MKIQYILYYGVLYIANLFFQDLTEREKINQYFRHIIIPPCKLQYNICKPTLAGRVCRRGWIVQEKVLFKSIRLIDEQLFSLENPKNRS